MPDDDPGLVLTAIELPNQPFILNLLNGMTYSQRIYQMPNFRPAYGPALMVYLRPARTNASGQKRITQISRSIWSLKLQKEPTVE